MTADTAPITTPAATFRALPPVFWIVWCGTLVNRAAMFVAPFLMIYLVRQHGVDPVVASVLLTVQGIGLALSNVVGGWLTDAIGRRATMIIGLTGSAGIMLLLPEAGPVWQLMVLVVALGLAGDLHRPAVAALVADVVPEPDRTRAYSLLHWAINLGLSVAMLSGGLLAEVSFPWLFRLDALTTLLFAGIVWRLLPSGSRPVRAAAAPGADGSPWRDRRLLALTVITFLIFVVYFQSYATLPLAVTDLGLTAADFGLILAVNGIAVAVLQPLLSGHLGRIPRRFALAGCYLLIGFGFGLVAFATNVPSLIGTVLLWGLGEIILAAVGSSYVASIAPVRARGRYLGVYGAAIACAVAAAPLAGTVVYRWNGDALWYGCAVIGVVVAAWQLMLRRETG